MSEESYKKLKESFYRTKEKLQNLLQRENNSEKQEIIKQQIQIIELVYYKNYSIYQIANEIEISVKEITNHVKNLLKRKNIFNK